MRKTTLTLAVLAVAGLTAGAALAQPPQQTPEQRQAAFKAADKNNDGKLSKEEFTATLPDQFKQYADQAFDGRDANKDGSISMEEFTAPMARRGGQ
jgi:Ca2+-binding EF-hand superfamily protein